MTQCPKNVLWDKPGIILNPQGIMTQRAKNVQEMSSGISRDKPGTRQNLQRTMTQCPKNVLRDVLELDKTSL
jgi:hypothetical protein